MMNEIPSPSLGKILELISPTQASAVIRGRVIEVTLLNDASPDVGDVVYLERMPASTEWVLIGCEGGGVPEEDLLPNCWIGYHVGGDLRERVRRFDPDTGADLGWMADAVGGFEDATGEAVTAQKCAPGATGYPLFVGTKDTAGNLRVYKIEEGGDADLVWSHGPFTAGLGKELYCVSSIWPTLEGTIYFSLGQQDGTLVGDPDNDDTGIYRSTDGGDTFSRVGHGRYPGATPADPPANGLAMHQVIVDEDFDRVWTIHASHTGLWPGGQMSFSDDHGVSWANCASGLDDNQLTLLTMQGIPAQGPFAIMRASGHTTLVGDRLKIWFCINPRAAGPQFFYQGESAANFLSSHGGVLYSDDSVLIRPRTDESNGDGWFSNDSGSTLSNPGIDWWVVEDATLRPGGYDAHERFDWFIAVPVATGGAVDLVRMTVDKGVTWSSIDLDGPALGVCFFRPRAIVEP